ncbi:MAG: peptidoglycan-binding protein [Acidobacteria bacterium]|nr:peptidoglycan-binding protein [Acidobacteriota bacterium]
MPRLSYRQPGLILERGGTDATLEQVRDLQRDLRSLGYLRSGLDGKFGPGTQRAVKALQHDLLAKMDKERGAAVDLMDYNQGRVALVNGVCNRSLANCISDMLDDPEYPDLPKAEDPRAENRLLADEIAALESDQAPVPFIAAILKQESGLRHFHEPRGDDRDTYITIGLDTNAGEKHMITSRGYGAGQYTLFHHPATAVEVADFMLDIGKNLSKAFAELREKFDRFVNGATNGTRADDRRVEIGSGPLRLCKFEPDDPRHLRDCVRCLEDAGSRDITEGVTRLHAGTQHRYVPTQYYRKSSYAGVPRREKIGCDWPYAVRRYNGSGVNSYHYQTRVLLFLSKFPKREE